MRSICAARSLPLLLLGAMVILLLASRSSAQAISRNLTADIPRLPLAQALEAFAQQTGMQVVYVSELAMRRVSTSAPAGLTAQAALTRMLIGTGLQFEFLNARTVRLLSIARSGSATSRPGSFAEGALPRPANWPAASLEEVVVSATKREEPLNAVPVSAAVLTATELDAAGVKDIGELAARIPGLEFDVGTQFGPGILSNLAIRGIRAFTGTAPAIGVYMDDVPIQSVHLTLSNPYPATFDLARVEVLRGPHGTLFGSNALGGAIRFIANVPDTTSSGSTVHQELSATQGGGASHEFAAAIGHPVVAGRLGARVSAWYRSDGGYIDRVSPFTGAVVDRQANRSAASAFRLALAFEASDVLKVTPSFTYQATQLRDTPIFFAYRQVPGTPGIASQRNDQLNGKLLRQPYQDRFIVDALKVEALLRGVEFTAVTAFYDRHASATVDETNGACLVFFQGCGNPLGMAYPSDYDQAVSTLLGVHQSAFTQELRLASPPGERRFSWLAGLFYSRSHNDRTHYTYLVTAPDDPGIYSTSYAANADIDGFAHLQLALSRRLRVGFGTRIGLRSGETTRYEAGFANTGAVAYAHNVGNWSSVPSAPRLEVTYQSNDDNYFYATVARASRSGGDNVAGVCNGKVVPAAYSADALWSYELGAKNTLINHHLQLDTSVFHVNWQGPQQHATDACGNSYTANAGLISSSGFELAADAVAGRFGLRLAVSYLDVHYAKTVLTTSGQVIAERGAVTVDAPEVPSPWSGALSVRYQWPLRPGLGAYLRADQLFSSRNPGPFVEDNPNAMNHVPGGVRADPATSRLNVQLGMLWAGLDLRLGVNNLLNSQPTLHLATDGAASSLFYGYTFRPRTFFLAATERF
jgi:outer membrane receptor protein involved in Fe transport